MGVVDKERLIGGVSADAPTGPFIEYGEVAELERIAAATPVRETAGLLVRGQNSAWEPIAEKASALLTRTKDLRVAAILARALLYTDGVGGFADGLEVLSNLVSRYWPALHPPLENDDATFRVNSVAQVGGREEVVVPLRRIPLVRANSGRAYALRDIELSGQPLAEGEAADGRPDPAEIEAAFQTADTNGVEELSQSVERSLVTIGALDIALRDLAPGCAPELGPLSATLQQMSRTLHKLHSAGAESEGANGGGLVGPNGDQGQSGPGVAAGAIRSRQDVVRVLDLICSWYQAHEPSSPVPLVLRRAKRLVFLDFLEAVRDLSPGGLSEIKNIAGLEE